MGFCNACLDDPAHDRLLRDLRSDHPARRVQASMRLFDAIRPFATRLRELAPTDDTLDDALVRLAIRVLPDALRSCAADAELADLLRAALLRWTADRMRPRAVSRVP
ncbi:MAG: hypothetical protein U0575_17295 [Phycisphaerales bacterium]